VVKIQNNPSCAVSDRAALKEWTSTHQLVCVCEASSRNSTGHHCTRYTNVAQSVLGGVTVPLDASNYQPTRVLSRPAWQRTRPFAEGPSSSALVPTCLNLCYIAAGMPPRWVYAAAQGATETAPAVCLDASWPVCGTLPLCDIGAVVVVVGFSSLLDLRERKARKVKIGFV
jgi:hypothetical protein